MRLAAVLLSLSTFPVAIFCQRLNHFNPPVVTNEISSDRGVVISDGNAVAISPINGAVVATHSDGTVFNIKSGAKFEPESVEGRIVTCKSGLDFYQKDGTEYLIYAVIDGTEAR